MKQSTADNTVAAITNVVVAITLLVSIFLLNA